MTKLYLHIRYCLLALMVFFFNPSFAQQLAFPGAEGAGRFTTGGRGGVVYEVSNLNNSGPGSLRDGVAMQGPRTIVFRVSGTIALEGDLQIRNGDLTIAGQTAPGDGIAIKGGGVVINADNIIIRYIRFRPGDILESELDALWGREQKDIIIDHCSMSWSTDEVGSFYDNENFTLQWSVLSESLYESVHGKGRHGYGGIWGGKQASFHHNLLAHHSSRNPRFNGARYTTTPETEIVDFRNNVIYNWGGNSAYGGEEGNHNMVANYYKPGPATGGGEKQYRIVDAYALDGQLGKWYVTDNTVEGYPEVSANNWNGGVQRLSAEEEEQARVYEPFPFEPVETHSAEEAYQLVLANAGATYPRRDPVDARIMEEVASGTATYGGAYGAGKGIIDTQETVGGWPELISAPAPTDTDHDGMPDAWEEANGLDPDNPEDGSVIAENGYSNLENYLNELLETSPEEDFLRHPSRLRAANMSVSSVDLSWTDNANRETAIVLERSADAESYEVIARLEANTATYRDENLEADRQYFYRLKAITDTEESAYSPVLAVQTLAIPEAPDPEGLVGFWAFNHSEGTEAEDLSGFSNHGTLTNMNAPAWAAGIVQQALNLAEATAGTHMLVPHADEISFDNNNSFTVAFWMKASESQGQAYLFHKGSFMKNSNGATGKWYGLELKDDMIRFAVDDDITKSEVAANSGEFMSGEWVHVALVRDMDSRMLRIYRNGVLVQEAADKTYTRIGSTEPLIIGNSGDLNVPFTGQIDEFKVYNYGLSQAEVSGIHAGIPMQAYQPLPADEATEVSPAELMLQWNGDASAYQLYLGRSADELELVGEDLSQSHFVAADLHIQTTYFWRVDAVGEAETIEGETWSFRTGEITGLADQFAPEEFNYYPNPFKEQLHISFELKKHQKVELSLYDMQNRLLGQLLNKKMEPGTYQLQLNASEQGLEGGMYVCILRTAEREYVSRVIYLKE